MDPRSATEDNDCLPFNEARIGGALMNFKSRGVDDNTVLRSGVKNEVKGRSTDQQPDPVDTFMMLFDQGEAQHMHTMTMCLPTEGPGSCYKVKTLPKISGVEHNMGYTTGYQEFIISGWGFGTDKDLVTVELDGVTCDVTHVCNHCITCISRAADESVSGIYRGS